MKDLVFEDITQKCGERKETRKITKTVIAATDRTRRIPETTKLVSTISYFCEKCIFQWEYYHRGLKITSERMRSNQGAEDRFAILNKY